ncbi:MAG: selenocysteine-specific translation elongation factor [Nitrospinota bacterium]|nr:MAG: selenocysteine-specific translation elongation factor [Nitrospinota bacterium]
MKQVILGTAGHIDHGKTSLIKALTGIDTDRLKEEKERGITIDLGFAYLQFDTETIIGIVDVPGHERFVKNMLAGAAGIDLVLLVIAADEGVMPQTREHLAICELLQVKDGLVALTKTDLVEDEWLELVIEDTREFLRGTFLEGKPIIPVSVRTGEGLDELVAALKREVESVEPKKAEGKFRLPIDRVFTIRGFGTVVTGTLFSGRIRVEERVEVYPKGVTGRVRGIQVHNRPVEEAVAGQRTALNLQGVEKDIIERGDVLARPGHLRPTFMLDATLSYLADAPRPLRNRARIRFHIGTSEIMGRVILLDREELLPGEECYVQYRLEAEALALPRDRYVIRSYSPIVTIGGGEILDVAPRKHRRTHDEWRTRFEILAHGSEREIFLYHLREARLQGLRLHDYLFRTPLDETRLRALIRGLIEQGEAVPLEQETLWVLHPELFTQLKATITSQISSYHDRFPLKPAMALEELRSQLPPMEDRIFLAALTTLQQEGVLVVERDKVRLVGHQVRLGEDQEAILRQIEQEFLAAGWQPPRPEEVFDRLSLHRPEEKELLQVLVDQGQLVRVKDQLFMHRQHVQAAEEKLKAFLQEHREITAAQFRDLLSVSRKFAIPFLEYFDSQRLTMRIGDKRVLRKVE